MGSAHAHEVPEVPEELQAFTPAQVAALLQINIKTLYDRISRGEVPGVIRTGRALRLARPAIVAWLSAGDTARAPGARKRRA
ncbi:helix-turn-helix domain-containing protein [Sorangium sp. So ce145]|uniref:helix-turn-helix domain-containing protein n=1 Tax=Sorangium sp. So ce145 TaxID=3133285 RepID=UPI003F5E22E5